MMQKCNNNAKMQKKKLYAIFLYFCYLLFKHPLLCFIFNPKRRLQMTLPFHSKALSPLR